MYIFLIDIELDIKIRLMSKQQDKKNTAILLGGIIALSGSCESTKNVDVVSGEVSDNRLSGEQMLLDSTTLVKRLQQLSVVEYDTVMPPVAMCYSMAADIEENYQCPICNSETPSTVYNNGNIKSIRTIVEEIKAMGYDVILDETMFCSHCSGKENSRPELIFKIRFSEKSAYHKVRSNVYAEYQLVSIFLKGEKTFVEYVNASHKTADECLKIVEKMTGLSR